MRPSSCNRGEGGMKGGGQLEIMMEEGEEKDWSLLLDSIKIGGGLQGFAFLMLDSSDINIATIDSRGSSTRDSNTGNVGVDSSSGPLSKIGVGSNSTLSSSAWALIMWD